MTLKYEGNCGCPKFDVVEQEYSEHYADNPGTTRYMIVVDEGWRSYILCSDMYEDKAEWLAGLLSDQHVKPGEQWS